MSNQLTIGILGGMGPRATVQFEHMLLERLTGGDQELPTIVAINDGSIPDRSAFLVGSGSDPLPRMQRNLTMLELLDADIICIPCNTACAPAIFNRLNPASSSIINLPEEVGRALQSSNAKRAFVLGTQGTIALGTYQNVCASVDVSYVTPTARVQRLVTQIIAAVKQNDMSRARDIASHVVVAIAESGCDTVILGCTELPLVKAQLVPPSCAAIDTLAVLADACVSYTQDNAKEFI